MQSTVLQHSLCAVLCGAVRVQSVVEEAREKYKAWSFYYTDVPRQGGISQERKDSIARYESRLGLGPSSENALVNAMIASGCDFFVGTMGSTFSLIIDDLRRTGGKESRGMLTVNRDRAWMSEAELKRLHFRLTR